MSRTRTRNRSKPEPSKQGEAETPKKTTGNSAKKGTKKKVVRGTPKVCCAYTQLVSVKDLQAHPKNPNQHPPSQINLLAKIIKEQGFRAPITVSKRSGHIIRGHGRWVAAKRAGMKQVPVDYQDYDSEADEIADLLADNKVQDMSSMNNALVQELLMDLRGEDFDLELAGFDNAVGAAVEESKNAQDKDELVSKMELQAFEHYDYLVFMFKDSRDWLNAIQKFGIKKVDYGIGQKPQIGLGRVINGTRLIKKLEENNNQ